MDLPLQGHMFRAVSDILGEISEEHNAGRLMLSAVAVGVSGESPLAYSGVLSSLSWPAQRDSISGKSP